MNERGEVIGVTVAKIESGESLNFALPINYARGLLQLEQKPGIEALQNTAAGTGNLFSDTNRGFPRRWKSLVSGATKVIRTEGDFIYIETVMPEDFIAAGGMLMAELKKQGDKWVGTGRRRIPCQTGDGVWTTIKHKVCSFDEAVEILLLTPTRIEGIAVAPPDGAYFKCGPCKYSQPSAKQDFVWIPE